MLKIRVREKYRQRLYQSLEALGFGVGKPEGIKTITKFLCECKEDEWLYLYERNDGRYLTRAGGGDDYYPETKEFVVPKEVRDD